jgi:hypothetical protein
VEILCVQCGTTLKEHARFCNNCGMLVPARPFILQSSKFLQSSHVTTVSQFVEEESLDDLPTRPLVVSSPDKLSSGDSPSAPSYKAQQGHTDDVEQLDTVPHLARIEVSTDDVEQLDTVPHLARIEVSSAAQPAKQASSLPHTLTFLPSRGSSGLRRNRKLLVLTLLSAVGIVLVGSLVAWIILLQPFSVPNITQPQQSFKDSKLGISLLYPRSWTAQVDHSKATVYFYDSSHTGQANIVVGGGSSAPTRSVQQQAGQFGMTAQKSEPSLTFAGTTWQRLQGNVQQEGASYTATLLVGVHNQHLYTIIFLAPHAIYTQEEQYVFASMRSSFQFLL